MLHYKNLTLKTLFFLTISFSVSATVIVSENFDGDTSNLNGETADIFSAAVTDAGGENVWAAGTTTRFQTNGGIVSGGDATAYLDLGTYIRDSRGTDSGLFVLEATLAPASGGSWVSFGFFNFQNVPTDDQFTNGTVQGLGTIIYRTTGELDMFGGVGTGNAVDGPDAQTGNQLLSIELDLRTYDGTTDFGTVSWYQGVVDPGNFLGSHDYTVELSFGSLGFSVTNGTTGGVDNLTLTQIPEPSSLMFGFMGLALVVITAGRRLKLR